MNHFLFPSVMTNDITNKFGREIFSVLIFEGEIAQEEGRNTPLKEFAIFEETAFILAKIYGFQEGKKKIKEKSDLALSA